MAISMIGLPFLSSPKPEKLKIIPIEMVKIADETKVKPQVKKVVNIKDKPKPEKKRVEERKVEMPPPPPKMASTMPLPEDKPKPKKTEDKKPDNKKAAKAPRVSPRMKPRPPSQFDSKKLAALLDKRQKTEQDFGKKLEEKGYEAAPKITDIDLQQQAMQITDAISKHITDNNCWNVPAGAKGAQDMIIVIHFQLNPDGLLLGSPKVVDSARMNRSGQEFYRAAAESALRAVRKCAPYDFLPRDKFDLWREIEMNFDPSEMLM